MINSNEYFEGKVKSLGYSTDGGTSTIGVMEAGDYEFNTSSKEQMIVIEGSLDVQLAGEADWKNYRNGDSFEVMAGSSFKVKSTGQTSYLCKYS
ncbi:MAG: pyrimidine/purine nucleoside phosphorylase [Cyclobacteriaceae bacterium]